MSLLYLFNLISLRHSSYNIRNADYIRKSNLSNTTHAFRFLMQLSNISQLLRHLINLCFTLNKRVFLVFRILYNDKICRFQLKIKLPAVFFWLLLLSKLLLASCHEIWLSLVQCSLFHFCCWIFIYIFKVFWDTFSLVFTLFVFTVHLPISGQCFYFLRCSILVLVVSGSKNENIGQKSETRYNTILLHNFDI